MSFQFDANRLRDGVVELIRMTSTQLPNDVLQAMADGRDNEEKGSPAASVLDFMIRNAEAAKENSTPICQDTGSNIHYVTLPVGVSMNAVKKVIIEATKIATEKAYLRPNAVDSVTGKNSGDNTGTMAPYIHFEEWDEPAIKIQLALKGGGSENVSAQYKLPDSRLKAGRNMEGVYKCVIVL